MYSFGLFLRLPVGSSIRQWIAFKKELRYPSMIDFDQITVNLENFKVQKIRQYFEASFATYVLYQMAKRRNCDEGSF